MTDRYSALIVVLEKDIREDDAESTIEAIRHIRGVLSVKGHISNPAEHIASSRIKAELFRKITNIFFPEMP